MGLLPVLALCVDLASPVPAAEISTTQSFGREWCMFSQELRQLLHQQSSASSAALDAERSAAAQQADECAAVAAASAQAASAAALHAAEVRSALLEGQLDSMERERDALARQVGVVGSPVSQVFRIPCFATRMHSCSIQSTPASLRPWHLRSPSSQNVHLQPLVVTSCLPHA